MSREPNVWPVNFKNLHGGEEKIRAGSIKHICMDDDLSAHANIIEHSMDVIDYFVRQHTAETEDILTLQLLGIRLFNAIASAIKLALGGYYQTSVLQQRDVLETTFLLNYFSLDLSLIGKWRSSNEAERMKAFAPAKVRTALDNNQGFTGRRREAAYKQLCELAAHPTQVGFRMVALPNGEHHCGPFLEHTALNAVWSELAKHAVQAAPALAVHFPARDKGALTTKVGFLESQAMWFERFFGVKFDSTELNETRKLLQRL